MSPENEFLSSERKELEQTLSLVDELLQKETWTSFETIAMGTLLQNLYTGLENILRFVLNQKGITIGRNESWHKELLMSALRERIVSDEEFDSFRELLLFRHLHIHGYSFHLDAERLVALAKPSIPVLEHFLSKM